MIHKVKGAFILFTGIAEKNLRITCQITHILLFVIALSDKSRPSVSYDAIQRLLFVVALKYLLKKSFCA